MTGQPIPAEELQRIAATLYAFARSIQGAAPHAHVDLAATVWHAAAADDAERFVEICADHGIEIEIDPSERLDDVMVRYHGGAF